MFYIRLALAALVLASGFFLTQHYSLITAINRAIDPINRARSILVNPTSEIEAVLIRTLDEAWFCQMLCHGSGLVLEDEVHVHTGHGDIQGLTVPLPSGRGFKCSIGRRNAGYCVAGQGDIRVFVRLNVLRALFMAFVLSVISVLALLGVQRIVSPSRTSGTFRPPVVDSWAARFDIATNSIVLVFAVIWYVESREWEPLIIGTTVLSSFSSVLRARLQPKPRSSAIAREGQAKKGMANAISPATAEQGLAAALPGADPANTDPAAANTADGSAGRGTAVADSESGEVESS